VPQSVFGLPLHPLIVHATVVIVPLAALMVLLSAVWPSVRSWAGPLPLGLALAGLVLDPLSTSSGENLEHQVSGNALIERHAQLADGLLPWMVALVVTAGCVYVWHWRAQRRDEHASRTTRPWLPLVLSGLAVVAALGTVVQVVLIGHSGAKAAWSDVAAASQSSQSSQLSQ
jgi:hypothetical protein